MMGSSSGSGYLNPRHVYELAIRRRPQELLDYLDLIPGASKDFNYQRLKIVGRALLALRSQPPPRLPSPEEDMQNLWAQLVLFHTISSRFCAPQMVGYPSSLTSDAGHNMHSDNSSSYSGRMLTHEPELRDAAVHNQLSTSNSRIHAATFPRSSDVISFPTRRARMLDETSAFNSGTHASAYVPLRGNSTLDHYMPPHRSSSYSRRMLNREPDSNEIIHSAASSSRKPAATLLPLHQKIDDVHRHAAMHNQLSVSSPRIHASMLSPLQENTMINFSTRRAGMCDETSASNSETHASAYVPLRSNSMFVAAICFGRYASNVFSDGCSSDVIQEREFAELSLGRPGSEVFTPQMLMRNTEDTNGKRLASEVDQIKAKILRLNVASVITSAGLKGAAGVLIRDDSTMQFMTASCFRLILYMDPALLFAAACCEGIKIAGMYEPTTIVLESHLVPLLEQLVATRSGAAEVVQLEQLLRSRPPDFIIWSISEESNGAACQLVRHALQMEEPKKVCKDPPDWLVPYLER